MNISIYTLLFLSLQVLVLIYTFTYTRSPCEIHIKKTTTTLNITKQPELIQPLQQHQCVPQDLKSNFVSHGNFTILNNLVRANQSFQCFETITLTTPVDFSYMKELAALAERWQGPISVAAYAPGTDFAKTLKMIAYQRNCGNNLIRNFVTFSLFFDNSHTPTPKSVNNLPLMKSYVDSYNCSLGPPENITTYRKEHKLKFPINVARNIARRNVQTHFVFASDVELFPTPNFIQNFLQFYHRENAKFFQDQKRRVFVLPIFEVKYKSQVPPNKTVLQTMMTKGDAVVFHQYICRNCHLVVEGNEWIKAVQKNDEINVFTVGKRTNRHKFWEPFYVGTNDDPFFDERLTWEGQHNKMTQAYSMCLMDYDFAILDNAFLVHKPGVKMRKSKEQDFRANPEGYRDYFRVRAQLRQIIGNNRDC